LTPKAPQEQTNAVSSASGGGSSSHSPASLLLDEITDPQKAPTRLSAEQVRSDLDLLLHAMREGYAGYAFLNQPETLRAFEAGLLALVEQPRSMSPEALCMAIARSLDILPDAHLAVAWVDHCRARPERTGPDVGRNLAEGGTWNWEVRAIQDVRVLVVAIRAFTFHEDRVWDGFDEMLSVLDDVEAVIVDLRGNPGGDDWRGRELASALAGRDVSMRVDFAGTRKTPEAFALLLNGSCGAMHMWPTRLPEHLRERCEGLKSAYEAALAGSTPAISQAEAEVVQLDLVPPNGFKGPIAVLVDHGCASSCEGTLDALRVHPNTRAFGARTGGFVSFGNGGELTLPHSQIRVRIPTTYFRFASGEAIDKVGFAPDVELGSGANALTVALDWVLARTPSLSSKATSRVVR
jgi:hypothetical protein